MAQRQTKGWVPLQRRDQSDAPMSALPEETWVPLSCSKPIEALDWHPEGLSLDPMRSPRKQVGAHSDSVVSRPWSHKHKQAAHSLTHSHPSYYRTSPWKEIPYCPLFWEVPVLWALPTRRPPRPVEFLTEIPGRPPRASLLLTGAGTEHRFPGCLLSPDELPGSWSTSP